MNKYINPFGLAPMKREGDNAMSQYGFTEQEIEDRKEKQRGRPVTKTTWIEFCLPEIWEDECWAMIEKWLVRKRLEQEMENE